MSSEDTIGEIWADARNCFTGIAAGLFLVGVVVLTVAILPFAALGWSLRYFEIWDDRKI